MKVFKKDDVIHHIHVILALRMLCDGCYRLSIVLTFPFLFLFVCSKTEREKLLLKKYPDTCGRGLICCNYRECLPYHLMKNGIS